MNDVNRVIDDLEAQRCGDVIRDNWDDWDAQEEAEWNDVTVRHRLIGHTGQLRMWIAGEVLTATIDEVWADCITLHTVNERCCLRIAAIESLTGLSREFPVDTSDLMADRLGFRFIVRQWRNREVRIRLLSGRVLVVALRRIGQDHLDVDGDAGAVTLPHAAIAYVSTYD